MDLEYGCKVSNRYTAFLDADNQPVGHATGTKAANSHVKRAPVRLRDRQQQRKPRGRNPADIIVEMCDRLTQLRPTFAALDENLLFPRAENGVKAAPISTPELSNGESTNYPDSLPDEPTNPNWSEICCAEEEALRDRAQTVPANGSQSASNAPEQRSYPTMYFYNRNFRQTFRDRHSATHRHRSQGRSDPGQDENDAAANNENDAAANNAAANRTAAYKYSANRKRSKRYTKRRPATANERPVADGAANGANRNTDGHAQNEVEPTSSDQASGEEKPVLMKKRRPRSLKKRRSAAS